MKTLSYLLNVAVWGALVLQSCSNGSSSHLEEGSEIEMHHAVNIKMTEHDGFTSVTIRNPWDTTRIMQKLILLDKDGIAPSADSQTTIVTVPLERTVVFSSVHASLMSELGVGNALSGVCDVDYITDPEVRSGVAERRIADCGNSMQPNVEKIIGLLPQAVLLSPYDDGSGNGKLEHLGIPLIQCADYMEPTPLGRAEWMRFYGRLFGAGERSDSLFAETEREYSDLKDNAAVSSTRPKVIFDRVYGQAWDMPGPKSALGTLVKDAGGRLPFEDNPTPGRITKSQEAMLMEAGDADIWLIRHADEPLTLSSLKADREIYTKFKAYKEGNVYGCPTISTNVFDDMAFHPQWLLGDVISVLHPESGVVPMKRYFKKLDN